MAKDGLLLIRGFVTTDRLNTCDEINISGFSAERYMEAKDIMLTKYNLQTIKHNTGLT